MRQAILSDGVSFMQPVRAGWFGLCRCRRQPAPGCLGSLGSAGNCSVSLLDRIARYGASYVYFSQGALLSLMTVLNDGTAIKSAYIGCEEAFGLSAAIYGHLSFSRCVLQTDGALVLCPVEALRSEFEHCAPVRKLLVRYSETLNVQVQQRVA